MESLVANGEDWMMPMLDLRDELASHRDPKKKRELRDYKRRNGRVMWNRNDKTKLVPGPYKFEYRKTLLRRVLETQQQVRRDGPDPNVELISRDELAEIRRLWRKEAQDWEDSVPKIYREVMGEDLDWIDDDMSKLGATDAQLLSAICRQHGVPDLLPHKLLDKVREKQGMGRRAGIYDEIDSVIREDWLSDEEIAKLDHDSDDAAVE